MFAATAPRQADAHQTVCSHNNAVELWVADTTKFEWLSARIHVLTEAERAEFAKIAQPAARWLAMSARILLRVALSDAIDGAIAPCDWRFTTGSCGKKRVADGQPQIHFSVSHNETMAVVAICRNGAVGVDVETLGKQIDEDVIAMFLSSAEQASLDPHNAANRSNQFVRYWTLKEAYSKLTGEGFTADFAAMAFDPQQNKLAGQAGDQAQFELLDIAKCQIAIAMHTGAAAQISVRDFE